MTYLLSDPRVVEAVATTMVRGVRPVDDVDRRLARALLTAAVAALPREELIETFTAAYTRSCVVPPYFMGSITITRHITAVEAGFAALGLISEHTKGLSC